MIKILKWEIDVNEGKILKTTENNYVTKRDFENKFGVTSSYENLIKHPKVTSRWIRIFDKWKEKGILD